MHRDDTLPLTGERTVPGIWHENYWFRRHEAAYLAVLEKCSGTRVLEVGCGEGYGADLLRDRARADVLALDYDPATLRHVRTRYPRLRVVAGNAVALPLADGCVDVVVALQVVEHLWDQPGFVTACARVLRPGGRLLLSTPNRLTFSPPGSPSNPFHSRELDAGELTDLLAPAFETTTLAGVHHGPRLLAWEDRHGDLVGLQTAGRFETWPSELCRLLPTITSADFVFAHEVADCGDLLAVAVRR